MTKKTIVSLTPIALQRDSRTLKMAASFSRFGYRSIVVEQQHSKEDFSGLGVEVISLNQSVGSNGGDNISVSHYSWVTEVLKFFWHCLRNVGLGYINDYISFQRFKKLFKKEYCIDHNIIPKGDLYVFHSYEFAEFALRLEKNAKIIYDAHDFYQEIDPSKDESTLVRKWIMPFRWKSEKKIINRCDVFLTVSQGLEEKYLKTSSKRPLVIKNAHDLRNDTSYKKNVREYLNLDPYTLIVCCVGNKKNGMALDQLLNVFEKTLTHMHLVFIGSGYDYDANSFQNIHFIPALNPNELVPFLRAANLGLIPYFSLVDNYKFALPNRFFQLLASELPMVFSSDLVEINQLNRKYSFGVATNIKWEEEIIVALAKISADYQKFKENIVIASKELSWQEEEKKLARIINILKEA